MTRSFVLLLSSFWTQWWGKKNCFWWSCWGANDIWPRSIYYFRNALYWVFRTGFLENFSYKLLKRLSARPKESPRASNPVLFKSRTEYCPLSNRVKFSWNKRSQRISSLVREISDEYQVSISQNRITASVRHLSSVFDIFGLIDVTMAHTFFLSFSRLPVTIQPSFVFCRVGNLSDKWILSMQTEADNL